MQHRRRWATAGAAVLGVGLLLAWWLRPTGPPEPIYKGRPLGAWLDDIHSFQGHNPPQPDYLVAEQAILAIGPAAIPNLVAWHRAPGQPIRQQVVGWLQQRGMTSLAQQIPSTGYTRKWLRATHGLKCLGPAGRSAYPELAAILLHSPDETHRTLILESMYDSGASVVRQFVAAIHDPDPAVRLRAVNGLGYAGKLVADEITIPALETLWDDPDLSIRRSVAMYLRIYNEDLGKLDLIFTQNIPEALVYNLPLIGAYRARARHLLPQIEPLTRHADPAVRAAARAAIEQIAPPPAP